MEDIMQDVSAENSEGEREMEDVMRDVSAKNSGVVNCDSIWWSLSNVGGEISLYTRVSLISVVSLH